MQKLSTPFSNIRSPVKTKEEIKRPFITDLSHQDNNQVLMKEVTQLKKWPKFTGEGEYDHMPFIQEIDMLQEDYAIPDKLITARLHSLFEKSSERWYYGIRQKNGKIPGLDKDKPLTWFLNQVEILNALYPEMSQKMVHIKILHKCGGELEHSLRGRCIEPCSKEEYINALEDIVTRTKIGRTFKTFDTKSPNKPFIKKAQPKESFKPNTLNSKEQIKFHKCGGIVNLVNNPLNRQKSMKLWEQKTTMTKNMSLSLKIHGRVINF
ncbi:hypothetical protein O181_038662 [Austropuccinia psidii MF-1]|uniref:Uncharacterized protein n=1 Tax=Austropuccinia psidii MF-1 TaxID=1389203 RepID=A0A9Q3DF72_9BASI|nr:hypothetical protein [Austropuccinia psidii MF-1]